MKDVLVHGTFLHDDLIGRVRFLESKQIVFHLHLEFGVLPPLRGVSFSDDVGCGCGLSSSVLNTGIASH